MQDMGVDHGGLHVSMPEPCLHGPNIVAGFQPLRGERVPKGMAGDVFGDPGHARRGAYRFLQTPCIPVMAARDARAGGSRAAFGGQHLVPAPRTGSVGICALQRVRQRDRAVALRQICGMALFHPPQGLLSRGHQGLRHHGAPLFFACALPHAEDRLGTSHLFDPHPHTLEPPHAAKERL